jgi:hypothetical protein
MFLTPPFIDQGQHDRTPVTTKHEKRLYTNPLFAVSLRLFSREAIAQVCAVCSPPKRGGVLRRGVLSVKGVFANDQPSISYRLMPSPQTPGSPWTLSPFRPL